VKIPSFASQIIFLQVGCGAQPDSCQVGIASPLPELAVIIHVHPVPCLRIRGSLPKCPLYASMMWCLDTGVTLPSTFTFMEVTSDKSLHCAGCQKYLLQGYFSDGGILRVRFGMIDRCL